MSGHDSDGRPDQGSDDPRAGRARGGDGANARSSARDRQGGPVRERMSADYDEEPARRRPAAQVAAGRGVDLDAWTRRLIFAAVGIGAVLLAGVGGWTLLAGHHGGIPVLGPPPGAVRSKPVNPGGMQLADAGNADTDMTGRGKAHLAPGPEQPDPTALARQTTGSDAGTNATGMSNEGADKATPSASGPAPAGAGAGAARDVGRDSGAVPGAAAPVVAPELPSAAAPRDAVRPEPARPRPGSTGSARPEVPAAASVVTGRNLAPPVPQAGSGQAGTERGVDAPAAGDAAGHLMVQLAALDTEAQAQAEWGRLQHRAPDLLGGRTPVVQPVARGGATLYRLRVSGFDDLGHARSFCAKLRAQHVACTPASF